LAHPLAQQVIEQAKSRPLQPAELIFQYSNAENKITVIENMSVKHGWCKLSQISVDSLSQTEDRLIWAAFSDDGILLEEDIARRLFQLPAEIGNIDDISDQPAELNSHTDVSSRRILSEISERNAQIFEAEITKLESWSDDRKVMLEREIKEFDRKIKEARRSALAAVTLEEKVAAQKEIKALERERTEKRRALFQAQDEIDSQRDNIIKDTEERMKYKETLSEVFCVRWRIV
jgi:adenine-specific DNA-methyltransferase